jgi:SAM-dependent methyltransferase
VSTSDAVTNASEAGSPHELDKREAYAHVDAPSFDTDLARRTAGQWGSFFLQHLRPNMRVLDCGCGPGPVTLGLAEAVAPGETVGIDTDPRQIAAATALALEGGVSNVRFELGSIYELPFPDASFEAAYAQSVLLHLSDPLAALKELRRVLKPGGVAGIVDGDLGCYLVAPAEPAIEKWWALQARGIEHHGGNPFYARNLRSLLHEAGFERTEGSATAVSLGAGDSAGRTAADVLRARFRGAIENTVIDQGWATRGEVDAMDAALSAWAEQPDTFLAYLRCSGLGWVPS